MLYLKQILGIATLIVIASFISCSEDDGDSIPFPLLFDSPCKIVSFSEVQYDEPCTPSLITRDIEGNVISISEDCNGNSYEFEYNEDGKLVRGWGKHYEYDNEGRLIKESDNTFTTFYTYNSDSIIVSSSSEIPDNHEPTYVYYEINELGLPGKCKEIPQHDCYYQASYSYDTEGNIIFKLIEPCQYRSFDVEYTYAYNWINPNPFPDQPGIFPKSKHALTNLFSNGLGPSGSTLTEKYDYEWHSKTLELSVYRTTINGDDSENSGRELIRIYIMDCQ